MELQVKLGLSGSWYVALVAENGETMMHSETYDSKGNAVRAANTILAFVNTTEIQLVVSEEPLP
jgi:uncharacterized protein YegP (UPF0339 family)